MLVDGFMMAGMKGMEGVAVVVKLNSGMMAKLSGADGQQVEQRSSNGIARLFCDETLVLRQWSKTKLACKERVVALCGYSRAVQAVVRIKLAGGKHDEMGDAEQWMNEDKLMVERK